MSAKKTKIGSANMTSMNYKYIFARRSYICLCDSPARNSSAIDGPIHGSFAMALQSLNVINESVPQYISGVIKEFIQKMIIC